MRSSLDSQHSDDLTPSRPRQANSYSEDANDEQGRALLEQDYLDDDIELSDNSDGLSKRPYTQGKKRSRWLSPWILVWLIGIAVTVAVLASFAAIYQKVRGAAAANESAGDPLDYILDPNWDFTASPARRDYHWIVRDTQHNPDGVLRPMILINDQFPAPLIECNEGDTISVTIHNEATNATSIHWHGLYQNGTNWMDGTVGITQCPIAPGTDFTYEFKVNGQSGTYWYHAHQAMQASDGMFGPLIIHSRTEKTLQKLDYATDRVVMVGDHYYDLTSELLMQYLRPDQENSEPVPDTALINGKNIRDCSTLSTDRDCDNSTATLPIFNLERDKRHRLRIINVGAFAEFQMQIDEHSFAVTEVDGTDVEPAYFHRLNINPAQRYSIILNTNVTTASSYWLRARMITHCFAEEHADLQSEVRAVINYHSPDRAVAEIDESQLPTSRDWPEVIELECKDMNVSELRPVVPIAAPSIANDVLYLRSAFQIGAWRLSRGFFNDSSWRSQMSSPSLHRAMDGLSTGNASFDLSTITDDGGKPGSGINRAAFDSSTELVYQTHSIKTIDILVSNFDDGTHPLHLHGYKFFVLASGSTGYPPAHLFSGTNSTGIDLSNPLRRDTASIEAFGWILLRVIMDNPGAWNFHCHVSWHAEAGLAMQFLTRTDDLAKQKIPDANLDLCTRPGIEKGRGPEDSHWFGNFNTGGNGN